MARIFALAVALCACGGKTNRDCDGYAAKFADTIAPDPSRRATVIDGAKSACEKGRVSNQQIECVHKASSEDAVRACMGVGGGDTQAEAPAAPTKKAQLSASGGGIQPISSMSPHQRRWFEEIERRVGNCEGLEAVGFDVVVTYTADQPTVDATRAPEKVRECVTRAFISSKPPGTADVAFDTPITFQVQKVP